MGRNDIGSAFRHQGNGHLVGLLAPEPAVADAVPRHARLDRPPVVGGLADAGRDQLLIVPHVARVADLVRVHLRVSRGEPLNRPTNKLYVRVTESSRGSTKFFRRCILSRCPPRPSRPSASSATSCGRSPRAWTRGWLTP